MDLSLRRRGRALHAPIPCKNVVASDWIDFRFTDIELKSIPCDRNC